MEEQTKRHNRRQNIISLVILIGGTILAFLLFGPKQNAEKEPAADGKIVAAVAVMEMGTDKSRTASLEKTATFVSTKSAEVVAQYSGIVRSVNFKVGDRVKQGQALVVFDQSETGNSARVAYLSAGDTYNIAKKNLDETRDLTKENVDIAESSVDLAEEQLDQKKKTGTQDEIELAKKQLEIAEDQQDQAEASANLQLNQAKLALSQAEANFRQARIGYEKTIVKAPISGTVVSKTVTSDEYLNSGQAVAQIVGSGDLETTVTLSTEQIKRAAVGDEVVIKLDNNSYAGKIVSFSDIPESDSGRFDVLISADAASLDLANKSAKVIINLRLNPEISDSFYLPLDAVSIGQKKTEVFVVAGGKARPRVVTLGEIIGEQVEITDGLSPGDLVITENSRNLQDGQEIKMID